MTEYGEADARWACALHDARPGVTSGGSNAREEKSNEDGCRHWGRFGHRSGGRRAPAGGHHVATIDLNPSDDELAHAADVTEQLRNVPTRTSDLSVTERRDLAVRSMDGGGLSNSCR